MAIKAAGDGGRQESVPEAVRLVPAQHGESDRDGVQAWHTRSKKVAQHAGAALSDLERLLYLTLKNLGDLEAAAPTNEQRRRMVVALYSDALSVDESDPLVWLRLGSEAAAGGAQGVSRGAFERGLKLHAQHPLLLRGLLHLNLEVRGRDAECLPPTA